MSLSGNSFSLNNSIRAIKQMNIRPGVVFGFIIVAALIFFEIFNFSTTDYALRDLLGGLTFLGLPWSTTLSIAFCGIDFAGIARLFTPEQGNEEPKEVWYLFGAWLLAATMNATLTWWGVSMAISNHNVQSKSVIDPQMIQNVVPIFVAVMVWVIRILIIGTISVAGDRFLWGKSARSSRPGVRNAPVSTTVANSTMATASSRPAVSSFSRPSASMSGGRETVVREGGFTRPEPTYHSLSKSDQVGNRSNNSNNSSGSAKF